MSAPIIVSVLPNSPAEQHGIKGGEQILAINGCVPRDVIEYQLLIDEPQVTLEIDSGGIRSEVEISRKTGAPLGIEVDGALFDRVRTCDNHCEFCFIYQLPPGLRKSLYLKDDDYRLSFLYGNFTTLTRFTESDLERVLVEGLSPLYVSIHSTDPHKRAEMLRNRRGATSLRWLSELLDNEVTVHGQVVVCPGVNDGYWLEDTLAGVAEKYSELASLCVVPLGVSKYTNEPRMRPHTKEEANEVIDCVESWQDFFVENLGRHLVYAADEYYLAAGREFPPAQSYGDFEMYEDGIGMARAFELEFSNHDFKRDKPSGFFASVEGAPPLGFRAPRSDMNIEEKSVGKVSDTPVGVLTGELGAEAIRPLIESLEREDVRIVPVENNFFGGNVGVTGLMVGEDLIRVLAKEPEADRYLLPDVCLSGGRFLDGMTPSDLPRKVEIIPTDGASLKDALISNRL
ncbi:MAG: Fe-S oxidoreductase [Acidimicrobiaceae bacterium]|nr:Fe-S oxidoreductase [Acidimicrobiaceae bacterium]|tara:strand:- start:7138 stop:8508 length:1371 start_codon:yes stop_codon:yes gene_type:complete